MSYVDADNKTLRDAARWRELVKYAEEDCRRLWHDGAWQITIRFPLLPFNRKETFIEAIDKVIILKSLQG